jgi:hypothetical protein
VKTRGCRGAAVKVNWRAAVCIGELLSVACTVNENVPGAEATPLIAPVEEFRLRPRGRVPEVIE